MKKIFQQFLSFFFQNNRITLLMFHGLYRGIKLNVSIKNQLGLILYPNEISLQRFLNENLNEGDIAFDIGSNIGYTSILASRLVGKNGHVYSFEPINETYLIFKKNISLNNCKNLTVINKAISNKTGEVEFNIPENGEGLAMSSMMWGKNSRNNKSQIVKTIKIDTDSNFKNLSPKIIKIDVEGAEGLVIEGMQKLISRCKPYLYIECSAIGRKATWKILKSLNYSCFTAKNQDTVVDFNLYKHNDFIWIPNNGTLK